MIQELSSERRAEILLNLRRRADKLDDAIQYATPTDEQLTELASLYSLIYRLENPEETELY